MSSKSVQDLNIKHIAKPSLGGECFSTYEISETTDKLTKLFNNMNKSSVKRIFKNIDITILENDEDIYFDEEKPSMFLMSKNLGAILFWQPEVNTLTILPYKNNSILDIITLISKMQQYPVFITYPTISLNDNLLQFYIALIVNEVFNLDYKPKENFKKIMNYFKALETNACKFIKTEEIFYETQAAKNNFKKIYCVVTDNNSYELIQEISDYDRNDFIENYKHDPDKYFEMILNKYELKAAPLLLQADHPKLDFSLQTEFIPNWAEASVEELKKQKLIEKEKDELYSKQSNIDFSLHKLTTSISNETIIRESCLIDDELIEKNLDKCCIKGKLDEKLARNLVHSIHKFSKDCFNSLCCYQNTMFTIINSLDTSNYDNSDIVSLLYQIRHDYFAYIFMKDNYNVKLDGTDVNLNEHGIMSNKTPDFILKNDVTKIIYLFEFSVTSSSDFADKKKGNMVDSKYEEELNDFRKLGYKAYYLPIILRLDKDANLNWKELCTITKKPLLQRNFLELAETLNTVTKELRKNLQHLMQYNNKNFKHKLYKSTLKDNNMTNIRTQFFHVITEDKTIVIKQNVNRIKDLIKSYDRGKLVTLEYDISNKNLKFVESEEGVAISNLDDWINNEIDHEKLLCYLKTTKGKGKHVVKDPNFKLTTKQIISSEYITNFIEHKGVINVSILTSSKVLQEIFGILFEYELENIDTRYSAPFDFDEVLNEAKYIIENPTPNEKSLHNFILDEEKRNENIIQCKNSYKEVNKLRDNKIYNPKSSFFGIITPNGFSKIKDFGFNREWLQSIIPFLSPISKFIINKTLQVNFVQSATVSNLAEYHPIQQQLQTLRTNINLANHDFQKTANAILVKTGQIKFKNLTSIEAIKLRQANYNYKKFRDQHKLMFRNFKLSDPKHQPYYSITLEKWASQQIEDELKRDYNNHYISGVGLLKSSLEEYPEQNFINDFRQLTNTLFSQSNQKSKFTCTYDSYQKTNPFSDNFKEQTIKELQNIESILSSTLAGASLNATEIIYTSILHLSQISMKSNRIAVDTATLNNTILMVKGGGLSKECTRPFKIIFETIEEACKYYTCHNQSLTWKSFKINDKHYIESPWIRLHIGLAEHFFQAKTKFVSFYSSMSEESHNYELTTYAFSFYMLMNGRRKLESFLHNYRQIYMNARALFSKIDVFFEKFCFYNRDYVFRLASETLLKSLEHLLKEDSYYNLLTNTKFINPEEWAINLYCSRLLPKAAADYKTELRSDIKNHFSGYKDCKMNKDIHVHDFAIDHKSDPHTSILNFNPRICWLVGCYISDHVIFNKLLSNFSSDLGRLYEQNIFNVANNRGCRLVPDTGKQLKNMSLKQYLQDTDEVLNEFKTKTKLKKQSKFKKENLFNDPEHNIFGKKGYQAFYEANPKIEINLIKRILQAPGPTSATMLQKLNHTTLYKFWRNLNNNYSLNFSIHPKIQWGGSREIYAPDTTTKCVQQLGEGVFKALCKLMDHEMIHISSNRRPMFLNTTIHERADNKNTYYMNYDYTKWGPGCNFLKYKYFIMGLISILPESTFVFLMQVCDKMLEKQIIIKRIDFNAVCKQKEFYEIIKDQEIIFYKDFVTVKFEHSFVMGIWNYLSSAFHAGVVSLFRFLLKNSKKFKKLDSKCDLFGVPHSDDYLGLVKASNITVLTNIIQSYENFGRHCNHVQSLKKCQVVKHPIQSEVVSIVRINNKILTMLPKFSANINIKPSYKGYVGEMKSLVGKVIEFIANGATLNQAYKLYRILIYFVSFKLYKMAFPMYDQPLELLGTPDEMPLCLLLYGGAANYLLHFSYNKEIFDKFYIMLEEQTKSSVIDTLSYNDNTRNKQISYKQRIVENLDDELKNLLDSKTLLSGNFKCDSLCKLQFVARLADNQFAAAMVSGHEQGGLSYLLRNNSKFCYNFKANMYIPWAVRDVLRTELLKTEVRNINYPSLLFTMQRDMKLFECLPNKLEFTSSGYLLKPCTVNYQTSTVRGLTKISFEKIQCYLLEPEYRHLLDLTTTELETISTFDKITSDMVMIDKLMLAENICSSRNKVTYLYASMPTDKRNIETLSDLINFMKYNTKRNYQIRNLSGNIFPELSLLSKQNLVLSIPKILEMHLEICPTDKIVEFINNYKYNINGNICNIFEIIQLFKTSTNVYEQTALYQLTNLINKYIYVEDIIFNNLPVMQFTKRAAGSGSIWFGTSTLVCRTLDSEFIFHLTNYQFTKIEIFYNDSKFSNLEDLNYFLSECNIIGTENPYLTKKAVDSISDEYCVGFNHPHDITGFITTKKNCKFYCPIFKFVERDLHYSSSFKPFDNRKITIHNKLWNLRLSNITSFDLDCEIATVNSNKELIKSIFNAEIYKIDKENLYLEFKKPINLSNLEYFGLSGLYIPNEIRRLLMKQYNPGQGIYHINNKKPSFPPLAVNILTNLAENYPDSIRSSSSNKLYRNLSRNYPSSFLITLQQQLLDHRFQILNKLLADYNQKKKNVEVEEYVSRDFIGDCFSLKSINVMKHGLNLKSALEEFNTSFSIKLMSPIFYWLNHFNLEQDFNLSKNTMIFNLFLNEESNIRHVLLTKIFKIYKKWGILEINKFSEVFGTPLKFIPDTLEFHMCFYANIIKQFKTALFNFFEIKHSDNKSLNFKAKMKQLSRIWQNNYPEELEDYILALRNVIEYCYDYDFDFKQAKSNYMIKYTNIAEIIVGTTEYTLYEKAEFFKPDEPSTSKYNLPSEKLQKQFSKEAEDVQIMEKTSMRSDTKSSSRQASFSKTFQQTKIVDSDSDWRRSRTSSDISSFSELSSVGSKEKIKKEMKKTMSKKGWTEKNYESAFEKLYKPVTKKVSKTEDPVYHDISTTNVHYDIKCLQYYNNPDDFYEFINGDDEITGQDKTNNTLALFGYRNRQILKNNNLTNYVFGTPFKTIICKHLGVPKINCNYKYMYTLLQPNNSISIFTLYDNIKFIEDLKLSDGVLLNNLYWKEYNNCYSSTPDNYGGIYGFNYNETLFNFQLASNIQKTELPLLIKSNEVQIKQTIFDQPNFNIVEAANLINDFETEKDAGRFHYYEPYGSAIKHMGVQEFLKKILTKSFDNWLTGNIKLTNNQTSSIIQEMDHLKLDRFQFMEAQVFIRSIMKNCYINQEIKSLTPIEAQTSMYFIDDLQNFIKSDPNYTLRYINPEPFTTSNEEEFFKYKSQNTGSSINTLTNFELSYCIKVKSDFNAIKPIQDVNVGQGGSSSQLEEHESVTIDA